MILLIYCQKRDTLKQHCRKYIGLDGKSGAIQGCFKSSSVGQKYDISK
jgi:hypothetical protein